MYYGYNTMNGEMTPLFTTVAEVVADIQDVFEDTLSEWECWATPKHDPSGKHGSDEVTFTCAHHAHYGNEDWSCDAEVAWPGLYCPKHGA